MEHFPGDITAIILSNLPSISYVLRCRSVCKKWRKIIDDPHFALSHFTISSGRESDFLLFKIYGSEIYMVEEQPRDSNLRLFKAIKLQVKIPSSYSLSSNPCNGLVGFCTPIYGKKSIQTTVYNMYVCNIATQDCVKLPDIHISKGPFDCELFAHNLGLGFDEKSNRFKLLLAIYRKLGIRYSNPVKTHVLTLGSNSWREIDQLGYDNCLWSSPVLVNGSLHWLRGDSILSFDLAFETFHSIEIPLSASPLSTPNFQLLVLGECLSIVDSSYDDHIELWTMKEYSVDEPWSKLVIMRRYADGGDLCRYVHPISLGKNGEVLLLYDEGVLVSFEAESGKYTPLETKGFPSEFEVYDYEVHPYVGNLMPLKMLCRME